jgi:serine/threonine protein kinase
VDPESAGPATAKLIGRYHILEALESGGMGTVYRAFDPRLQTQVCIKQIKDGPDSGEFRKRWLPEVRAIAQLRHHPNIVNIYDASEAEFGGRPTIVMEFIEGRTVHRIIKERDRISLSTRLHYMEQLAAGLAFAHSKQIVHRDIKPANLMVDRAGVLKILDFGIARMSGGATASAVVGTMNYMSPEQWGRDPVDARTDIFSAGAVFYEILCGRRAFAGETVTEVYPQILSGRPARLEDLCPGLDTDVVRIVNRMLEKRPADRFPSLDPVQRDLARIRSRLTPAAEENFTRTLHWEELGADAALTPSPPSPGRAIIDRESVARRRAAKIDTAVHAAQQAFSSSSYDDVLVACAQVLELDPEHSVALDLMERARSAIHLQDAMARVHATIDAGELEQAQRHIAVVLNMAPTHAEALRLRTLVNRLLEDRHQRSEPRPLPPSMQPTTVVPADVAAASLASARHATERPVIRFWRPLVGALAALSIILAVFVLTRPGRPEPGAIVPAQAPQSTPQPSAPQSAEPAAPAVPQSVSPPAAAPPDRTESASGQSDNPSPVPRGQSSGVPASRPPRDRATADRDVSARLEAIRYLRRARENLDLGEWEAAAAAAEKARQLDPSLPELSKVQQDIETLKRLELPRRKSPSLH